MVEWLKVKPKTCVQLSSWPSHLSNQHFIESSILIFSFNFRAKSRLIFFVLTLDMIREYQVSFSVKTRGGVEDTWLEAKAKDTKKIRGQGQPFRGQTLSRPRTGMLEAKDQDTSISALQKKIGLHKNFLAISTKKRFPKNFSTAPQNFNNSKNTAVLEPRTGQFSRT